MKFDIRTPSLRRMVAVRSSPKRIIESSLGLKTPRGLGWVTNPRRSLYNRVYNRTSGSVGLLLRSFFTER